MGSIQSAIANFVRRVSNAVGVALIDLVMSSIDCKTALYWGDSFPDEAIGPVVGKDFHWQCRET